MVTDRYPVLIKFANTNGNDVWVNPDHVVGVFPGDEGITKITPVTGYVIYLRAKPQAVVAKLTGVVP